MLFLDKMQDEYDNTDAEPGFWWSDDEARYLLRVTRNYSQYNFTLEERNRAAVEAMRKFFAARVQAQQQQQQNSMQIAVGIIGDIIDNVVSVADPDFDPFSSYYAMDYSYTTSDSDEDRRYGPWSRHRRDGYNADSD